MAEELPRAKVEITDFPGLVSYADPDDIPPGASQVQINVTSTVPGELRSRPGLSVLTFETES